MKYTLFETYVRDLLMLGEASKKSSKKPTQASATKEPDTVVPPGVFPGTGGKYYTTSDKSRQKIDTYAGRVTGSGASRKWVPKEQDKAAQQKPDVSGRERKPDTTKGRTRVRGTAQTPTTGQEALDMPTGVYIRNGTEVWDAPTGGTPLGRIKNVDGKPVFFKTGENEREKIDAIKASRKAQTTPTKVQPSSVDFDKVESEIQSKIDSETDEKKKQVFIELLDSIKSRDTKRIQKVLTDYEIEISKEGKLKAKKLGKKSDEQKIFGDNKQLSSDVFKALEALGVQVAGTEEGRVAARQFIPGQKKQESGSEQFKPTRVFQQDEPDKLDVKTTETGIEVEGYPLDLVTDEQLSDMISERSEEARDKLKRQGKTEEEIKITVKRLEAYIRARVREQNHNIEYLRNLAAAGEKLPAHQFEGDEGKKVIAQRLSDVIGRNIPDETKRAQAESAVRDMQTATTFERFNDAWKKLYVAIKGSPAEVGVKYIAEVVTALYVVSVLDGVALIPLSDSFPLSDVLSIRQSPFTRQTAIEQLLVDVDTRTEFTVAASTKAGAKGAGSGNLEKILNSSFNTGDVDGVDCRDVQQDLATLASPQIREDIFEPTKSVEREIQSKIDSEKDKKKKEVLTKLLDVIKTRDPKKIRDFLKKAKIKMSKSLEVMLEALDASGDVPPAAKRQIMGTIEKYSPMIREYYGLPGDPPLNDADLYEFLSYGLELACFEDEDGVKHVIPTADHRPDGSQKGDPFKQGRTENGGQWRAWSVLGKITDAIHNRTVEQQFYRTVLLDEDGIVIADGIRTFSKMEAQHIKNTSNVPGRTGFTKPDQNLNAFTVPASREETRNGNPCETGKRIRRAVTPRQRKRGNK